MSGPPRIVLLDSRPLGLATNPRANPEATACKLWLQRLLQVNHLVLIPEITDYEVRRELLRAGKIGGLSNLDTLKSRGYLPLTTAAMLQAAAFWAEARRQRLQTADNLALDADMILAAQAATLDPAAWAMPEAEVVIATSNVSHLARFTRAQEWQTIT